MIDISIVEVNLNLFDTKHKYLQHHGDVETLWRVLINELF